MTLHDITLDEITNKEIRLATRRLCGLEKDLERFARWHPAIVMTEIEQTINALFILLDNLREVK